MSTNTLVAIEKFQIAVIEGGWVLAGDCLEVGDLVKITDAKCIRRWGTNKGLGQIAESGPTGSTVLDPVGEALVPKKSIRFLITCKSRF